MAIFCLRGGASGGCTEGPVSARGGALKERCAEVEPEVEVGPERQRRGELGGAEPELLDDAMTRVVADADAPVAGQPPCGAQLRDDGRRLGDRLVARLPLRLDGPVLPQERARQRSLFQR